MTLDARATGIWCRQIGGGVGIISITQNPKYLIVGYLDPLGKR